MWWHYCETVNNARWEKRQLETVLLFLKLPFWKEMLTSWSTDRIYHLIAICHHWRQQADHKTPLSCCSSGILVLFGVLRCSGLIKTPVLLWQDGCEKGPQFGNISGVSLAPWCCRFSPEVCSSGVIRQLDHDHINRWIKEDFVLPSCIQLGHFEI